MGMEEVLVRNTASSAHRRFEPGVQFLLEGQVFEYRLEDHLRPFGSRGIAFAAHHGHGAIHVGLDDFPVLDQVGAVPGPVAKIAYPFLRVLEQLRSQIGFQARECLGIRVDQGQIVLAGSRNPVFLGVQRCHGLESHPGDAAPHLAAGTQHGRGRAIRSIGPLHHCPASLGISQWIRRAMVARWMENMLLSMAQWKRKNPISWARCFHSPRSSQ